MSVQTPPCPRGHNRKKTTYDESPVEAETKGLIGDEIQDSLDGAERIDRFVAQYKSDPQYAKLLRKLLNTNGDDYPVA